MESTAVECVEYKHTSPLDDVSDLLNFDPCSVDPCTVSKSVWSSKTNSGSKVMVCHDMEGGYNDDKFVQGTDNPSFYNFYHWDQIDSFIYFSHHFVTIPPFMWVEAAHKNGVKVLGTFITEWEAGAEKCSALFDSAEAAILSAQKLAHIAKAYNFEGWLINIENELSSTAVENIQIFLQYLTSEMRRLNDHSSVIWYDAVTVEGKLEWQNSVTDLNSSFLQCCDGIFLNYTWKDWQLQLTMELTQDRPTDVYVGIDVWARGCLGKFESHLSTERIVDCGFSVALFAPAWVYENNKPNFPQFIEENNKFWSLLQPTCPPNSLKVHKDSNYVTNFSFGFGTKFYTYGFLLYSKSWYNLSKQAAPFINFCNKEEVGIGICSDDAFEGSTCLKVNFDGQQTCSQLIFTNADVSKEKSISLVCKSSPLGQMGDLKLIVWDEEKNVHQLEQTSNSYIGGNHWRRIVFYAGKDIWVRSFGLSFQNSPKFLLLGQLFF